MSSSGEGSKGAVAPAKRKKAAPQKKSTSKPMAKSKPKWKGTTATHINREGREVNTQRSDDKKEELKNDPRMLCAKRRAASSKKHKLVSINQAAFYLPTKMIQPASDGKNGFRIKKEERRHIAVNFLKFKDLIAKKDTYQTRNGSKSIKYKKGCVQIKAEGWMKTWLGLYGFEYVDCEDEYEEW